MSSPENKPICEAPESLHTDSLADSVLILLALTVVQRLVGFCRAVLFCRWMDPEALGQWDMAFSFLLMAAPLSVLTLSSSFRRYVEHYRQRSQLRMLLRRTATFYGLCGLVAIAVLWTGRRWFSLLVFGTADHESLMALMIVSLVAVLVHHFFIDLMTALRNVRLISSLQVVQSVLFAVLGIGLLLFWRPTAASVVTAYAIATAVVSLIAMVWLARSWKAFPQQGVPPSHRQLWNKLLPFVGWIWVASFMGNLFTKADRYMIIHFSSLPPDDALGLVGQYHSSRVVPLLLVSVAAMLGTVITPHLSRDWEAGRKQRVSARLNLYLKLTCFGLTAVAVSVLFVAPVMFSVAFEGKFNQGLAVLPWTLIYCIWFGVNSIAHNYLWCAEKTRLASLSLLAGLVLNVGLNLLLLPRFGLLGAVLATCVANLIALLLIAAFNHRLGFRMDRGTWVAMVLPSTLCLGAWTALLLLVGVAVEAIRSDRFLSVDEKQQFVDVWMQYRRRFQSFRLGFRSVG